MRLPIEYEATFLDINVSAIRRQLKKIGAKKIYSSFLQKRYIFNLPKNKKGSWLRLRQEKDKITMSLKVVRGSKITDQKEICLKIDNLETARQLLLCLGCEQKAYQENWRELWKLNGAEITIDHWPFLDPYLEIEDCSEKKVKNICRRLSLDYKKAIFGAADIIYAKKYKISLDRINNHTPKIIFNMPNPFLKK
ncbi:MAG: CYTH domain-containing protein [Patescibacteria group bacterium]